MLNNQVHWRRWITKRKRVTGSFTGTTDRILQWGAYKWGLDEDLLRAVAVRESHWRQSAVGDNGASFGIMQVRNHNPDGSLDFGGYPWTQRSTALNVDFYGAVIRSLPERRLLRRRFLALQRADDPAGDRRTRVRLRPLGLRRRLVLGRLVRLGQQPLRRRGKAILAARPWRHWRG